MDSMDKEIPLSRGIFMDSIIVRGMKKPCSCIGCPFLSKGVELYVKKEDGMSLYTKSRRCNLAPEDVEDPWKSEDWFVDNIEPYCPIEECKEGKR